MSQIVTTTFTYDVEALDRSVRKTNSLLRFANAVRLSVKDIREVLKAPTISNVMWTLIQLTRTYTALKRLLNSIVSETNALLTDAARLRRVPGIGAVLPPRPVAQSFAAAFGAMAVNVDAYINGIPVPIDAIDISDIRNRTLNQIQRILEDDAPQMVDDARRILRGRILRPELSTGRLEGSIGWESNFPGTTVFAAAPYSFWVEEGQRSFTGHHFLRDATEFARVRIDEKIRSEIEELVVGRK